MKINFYDSLDMEKLGKRVFEFAERYEDIEPQIKTLRNFEDKYPFFRIRKPIVNYNGQIFDFSSNYNIYLDAAWNGGSIHVGLNGTHAGIRIMTNRNRKILEIEAQELMRCDPNTGYQYIKRYFEDRGKIVDNLTYSIKIENDILLFQDYDMKHSIFRGETGGYDPSYTGSLDSFNRDYITRKNKWTGGGFNSLEKRIKSLKKLFDDLVDFSKLEPVKKEIPKIEMPDYKMLYARLAGSQYYKDMIKFAAKLSKELKISDRYDMNVVMNGSSSPDICLTNEDEMTTFRLLFCDVNEAIGTCNLNIPKSLSTKKTFDKRVGIYSYNDKSMMHQYKDDLEDDSPKIIHITEDIKNVKDIPNTLEKCLKYLR
ncbi:MAG TPA: hypothetical protein VEC16_03900 [Alphaproteobacteria bacterium]|nr:hypothetical protein [Alphaproteobacteria bacterium]